MAHQARNYSNNEFSPLMMDAKHWDTPSCPDIATSIAGAGIYIFSPHQRVENYLQLLIREMEIKAQKGFLKSRQPINYLRLSGLPLRSLPSEEMTQLMFWICSHYSVNEGNGAERHINLTPDQCTSNQVALLAGLGFDTVTLCIDGSIAGPDRSLDPVIQAIKIIDGYRIKTLAGNIRFSGDTSPEYMKSLIALLTDGNATELQFEWDSGTLRIASDNLQALKLYDLISQNTANKGYLPIGNKCFIHRDRQELTLRRNNRLRYGPWGFYNAASIDWLGLGVGAAGSTKGFMYRNSCDFDEYEKLVRNGLSPVTGWSKQPTDQVEAFQFIQDIYCRHKVRKAFFEASPALLQTFRERKWISEEGEYIVLTLAGSLDLTELINLYSRAHNLHKPD